MVFQYSLTYNGYQVPIDRFLERSTIGLIRYFRMLVTSEEVLSCKLFVGKKSLFALLPDEIKTKQFSPVLSGFIDELLKLTIPFSY